MTDTCSCLPQCAVQRRPRHAEALGHVHDRHPAPQQHVNLAQCLRVQLGFASVFAAACAGCRKPSLCALPDQVALELGQGSEQVERESARGAGGDVEFPLSGVAPSMPDCAIFCGVNHFCVFRLKFGGTLQQMRRDAATHQAMTWWRYRNTWMSCAIATLLYQMLSKLFLVMLSGRIRASDSETTYHHHEK